MYSLRLRLTFAVTSAIIGIGLLAMMAAYFNARQEIDEMFDFEIKAFALSIDPSDILRTGRDIPDDDIVLQVWAEDGTETYSSDPSQSIPRSGVTGYSTLAGETGPCRAYVRRIGNYDVQVSQALSSRRELAVAYSLRLLAPLLLVMPLMAAAIWWLIWRSMRPVDQLGTALAARTDGALDAVDTRQLPKELLPLVAGFNHLLQKLKAAFEAQRNLIADAAHELRTPLAVVQIQAQTLERLGGPHQQSAALSTLLQGVSRATRVVQQLLTLARHDTPGTTPTEASVDLTDLVRAALAELLPLASAQHIEMSLQADDDVPVIIQGDHRALHALVANLVDNAIKYTPAGGEVSVTLSTDHHHRADLVVADTGPGIPVEQRRLVMDRFYRIPGSAAVGSGLGLSIAAAVVQQHRGTLTLNETVGGGLCVRVILPCSHALDAAEAPMRM
jgi:two-component system OmpR family sensor kinase